MSLLYHTFAYKSRREAWINKKGTFGRQKFLFVAKDYLNGAELMENYPKVMNRTDRQIGIYLLKFIIE